MKDLRIIRKENENCYRETVSSLKVVTMNTSAKGVKRAVSMYCSVHCTFRKTSLFYVKKERVLHCNVTPIRAPGNSSIQFNTLVLLNSLRYVCYFVHLSIFCFLKICIKVIQNSQLEE